MWTYLERYRPLIDDWPAFVAAVQRPLPTTIWTNPLKTTPAAIVLPITATTPLVVIPFTWYFDHDRPGWRALIGGLLAVGGVIGLTLR